MEAPAITGGNMRKAIRFALLGLVGLWGCSSKETATQPPPPTSSVATVDVTPGTGTLAVAATLQLNATPRDAQGAAVTGVSVSWSTSAATVATVSSSGMVTAVAGGTATITATAGGKQGTAVITVTASPYGPIVAQQDIGTAGGTVGNTDIGVTIPSGAFSATQTVKLIRDTTSGGETYSGNSASAFYLIDGLPSGVTTQARVRIKTTGTNAGLGALGLLRPANEKADTVRVVMGLQLIAATDSAGYMVATVPLTGRTSWAGVTPAQFRRVSANAGAANQSDLRDPTALVADAELVAMLNLTRVSTSAGKFEVWGFGATADHVAKVNKTAGFVDQAYTKLNDMGYSFAFRATWPLQIFVRALDANGVCSMPGAFPKNINLAYIEYNKANTDLASYSGTVIHEMFHFVKGGILPMTNVTDWNTYSWIDEATSTWMAEKHPAIALPFENPTARSWRASMYAGFTPAVDMAASKGYGMAPMIKYQVKRFGEAKVKTVLDAMHGGADPNTTFFNSFGESAKLWWPDLLNQYVGGSLYAWPSDTLIPKHRYNLRLDLGNGASYVTDQLWTLGVEGELLVRDTSMFGPNFELPIYLDAVSRGHGTILAYQKSAASAYFRPLAAGDTVKIPGYLLQRPDSLLLLLSYTDVTAPYNSWFKLGFVAELRVPPADWYFPKITNLNSGVAFSCDRPGNTVTMALDTNAIQLWSLFSSAGTWKQGAKGAGRSETLTWAPTPAFTDSLAKYHMTMTSTLTTGTSLDTIKLQARFKWDLSGVSGVSPPPAPAGASLWWLLLPLGAAPLLLRRRSRTIGAVIVSVSLVVMAGCVIGQINFVIDETLDFTFTKMRFTADPAKPNDPLMQVYQGDGRTTINSYRSEYWSYSTNAQGGTDSVKVVCTGSGTATYKGDGTAMKDSAAVPATSAVSLSAAVRQLLGRPVVLPESYLKGRSLPGSVIR